MVGDGINDTPAFACADVSFSFGAAAALAANAASVVIANNEYAIHHLAS